MENSTRIIKYTDNELSAEESLLFEKELGKNPELMYEYNLHVHLNNFMKGKFMYEQLEQDSLLEDVEINAKEAIKDYIIDGANSDILDFLNKGKSKAVNLDDEISQIEKELSEKGIDKSSIKWVEDWNDLEKDTEYFNEIKAFVSSGMKVANEAGEQKLNLEVIKRKGKENRLPFRNRWIFAAASVAATLIISIALWTHFNSSVNNSELFASNYKPYKIVSKQLRGATHKNLNYEAVNLYKSQEYGKASLLLKNIITKGDNSAETHFLYAMTLIEKENYDKAIYEFKGILLNFDNYQIESKWYLSLCYLKTDKTDKAVSLLKELSLTKNYYQERALKILAEIN